VRAGDEVYYAGSIARAGSNQQRQLVDSRIAGFKPASLDWGGAAALPLTALTAWESLFDRLRIPRAEQPGGAAPAPGVAGKTLLIVNGAGGVGSVAIQLAKLYAPGLRVVATAGKPESVAWCRKLGADAVISHREPFKPQLEALGVASVEYIYVTWETAPIWGQLVELLAPQGAINTIVLTPGDGSKLDLCVPGKGRQAACLDTHAAAHGPHLVPTPATYPSTHPPQPTPLAQHAALHEERHRVRRGDVHAFALWYGRHCGAARHPDDRRQAGGRGPAGAHGERQPGAHHRR
jgi:NADPH:quinone reductase-like Zn-dependent oxidoreductase